MAGTPIDLSAYKPVAGEDVDAVKIANGFTAVEGWSDSDIDPAALKQNAATTGQVLRWDGAKWAPADQGLYPVAPTVIFPPTISASSSSAIGANNAFLQPITVTVPTIISRFAFIVTGSGGTGNVDVGIYYSDDEATFTRLVSKGSTATPATGGATLTISPTTMTPVAGRRWYLAFGCNSGTPAFSNQPAITGGAPGFFFKASSFPLPASLTSVSTTGATMPVMWAMV